MKSIKFVKSKVFYVITFFIILIVAFVAIFLHDTSLVFQARSEKGHCATVDYRFWEKYGGELDSSRCDSTEEYYIDKTWVYQYFVN